MRGRRGAQSLPGGRVRVPAASSDRSAPESVAPLNPMFETEKPLYIHVGGVDGLAHLAEPDAEDFRCGQSIGGSARVHGLGGTQADSCPKCWEPFPEP